jgi:hypothetical protein
MQRGQWSEQPMCVLRPATDDQIQKLKVHITALAPTFNIKTDANAVGLRKHPVLQQVLQDHTRSGLYIWQYSRVPQQLPNLTLTSTSCPVETEQTEALSEVAGAYASNLHQPAVLGSDSDAPNIPRVTSFCWLPAPVPQESLQQADTEEQELYAAYSQVAGFEPCYGYAPSLLKRNASGMKAAGRARQLGCEMWCNTRSVGNLVLCLLLLHCLPCPRTWTSQLTMQQRNCKLLA